MPSARRCARRSVALVARQGLSRAQAAEIVMHLCDDVANRLYQQRLDPDLTWLAAVRAEARQLWQRDIGSTPSARLRAASSLPADRCSECADPQCPNGCNWANWRPAP